MGAGFVAVAGFHARVGTVAKLRENEVGVFIFDIVWEEVRAVAADIFSLAALSGHS